MARNERKNKSSIIIIILIIAIILISLLIANNIFKYNSLKDNLSTKNKEFIKIEEELKNEENNKNNSEEELNKIKNIDETINNTKNEVFELAKKLEQKIVNGETNYKIAYITFDDGPYYLTYKVLDALKQNKIKATFFTIGLGKESCYDNASEDCTKLYNEIVKGGHTIANHTYSHLIFGGLYDSPNSFINQIKKQEELIKNKTGATTNITRFPGGSATAGYNKNGIIEKLRENHYGWVDWTAADGDGGSLSSKEVAWSDLTSSINENIEVILFHDYSDITLSILPDAIKYLQDNNYIILPLFYDSIKVNK